MADVETSVSSEGSFSISMDGNKEVERDHETGIEAIPEDEVVQLSAGEEGDGEGDEQEVETDGGDDEGSEAPEDLGDFDPEDTEKWDARYKGEDGKLNEEALSVEFWSNATDDVPGSLNEGTYAYLESIGISKAMAKNVEAALVTQKDATKKKVENRDGALFELAGRISGDEAGGADALAAALKWGKEGGYTEAQQKRFNDVLNGTDEDARLEAVELLMTRYGSANGTKKPALPKRDATKGRGQPNGGGLKPFKNRQEAREARAAAGSNQKLRQQIAARMALGYSNE